MLRTILPALTVLATFLSPCFAQDSSPPPLEEKKVEEKKEEKKAEEKKTEEKKAEVKEDTVAATKAAMARVNAAKLTYNGTAVNVSEALVTDIVIWGDAAMLPPAAFKTRLKLVGRGLTKLPADVHLGTKTAYLGASGGWHVFVSQAAGSGLAFAERAPRLVVFVPFDGAGFGLPSVVEGVDNGLGYEYHTPVDYPTTGYFSTPVR
ncbi:MAG: hypothetical protein KGJ06_02755 [Pseudomonadota bacterium]|nr:hypothetical protein [Pseudomonadota bacterium]